MRIERLRLKNFKTFRNVTLDNIPALAIFVGVNGSGKTTLFDAFDFLRSSINDGVNAALHNAPSTFGMTSRGGFDETRTRGETGPIEIEIDFLASIMGVERPINYLLQIDKDDNGKPCVTQETLKYPLRGAITTVLNFSMGRGTVMMNEAEYEAGDEKLEKQDETLGDPAFLAVVHACGTDRYKAAGAMRKFIADWHLSNFHNFIARNPVDVGDHKHLNPFGRNLAGFVQFMQDKHSNEFAAIVEKMSRRVPGFCEARAKLKNNGQISIEFTDTQREHPFDINAMSGGTLRMLGALSLLHDPKPSRLLCMEEPEREMYPHLLGELVDDFRRYAHRSGGHVLISTHSYEVLNAAEPEEVFLLEKRGGVTSIRRAKDDEKIRRLVDDEGDVMGRLWRMGRLLTEEPAL